MTKYTCSNNDQIHKALEIKFNVKKDDKLLICTTEK